MKRSPVAPLTPPVGAPQPGAGPIPPAQRTPAMILHLSPLLGLLLPGVGNVLGPLVAWLFYRDQSPLLDEQGKEALNFQISMWIYSVVGVSLIVLLGMLGLFGGMAATAVAGPLGFIGLLGGGGLLMLGLVAGIFFAVLPLIAMVLAVISVSDGRPYFYPFTLRLLR